MKRIYEAIGIGIFILLCSCGNNTLSPSEYMKWYASTNNPLVNSREMGEFTFKASIVPIDYYLAKQYLNGEISKGIDSSIYIRLEIFSKDHTKDPLHYKSDENTATARINYLIGAVQEDGFLITERDTFQAIGAHFERTYHTGNSCVVMFIFSQKWNEIKQFSFLYHDQLLGSGPMIFNFSNSEIKQIPHVKI